MRLILFVNGGKKGIASRRTAFIFHNRSLGSAHLSEVLASLLSDKRSKPHTISTSSKIQNVNGVMARMWTVTTCWNLSYLLWAHFSSKMTTMETMIHLPAYAQLHLSTLSVSHHSLCFLYIQCIPNPSIMISARCHFILTLTLHTAQVSNITCPRYAPSTVFLPIFHISRITHLLVLRCHNNAM